MHNNAKEKKTRIASIVLVPDIMLQVLVNYVMNRFKESKTTLMPE